MVRFLLPLCMILGAAVCQAQNTRELDPKSDLYRTLAALDQELFASASADRCDIAKFESFFSPDTEFYHDAGGLTVGSQTLAAQVKQNLCGKVRRELVPGTLKVYPMDGFGAVQMGVHRFCQPAVGPKPLGMAKFVHLWRQKDGVWKLVRVISYDHVGLPQ